MKDKELATPQREVWVDWLRVFACLLVMVVHSSEPFYLNGYDTMILTDALDAASSHLNRIAPSHGYGC